MSDLDLALDADGDLAFVDGQLATVDGLALPVQRVRITLRTQLGAWPFDLGAGVPWRSRILVKSPDLVAVGAAIRAALLRLSGVERVEVVDLAVTAGTLSGRVTINGEVVVDL